EHDPQLLAAARAANMVHQRQLATLRQDLSDDSANVRTAALLDLGFLGDPVAAPWMLPFLDADLHSSAEVEAAILSLTRLRVDIATQLRTIINEHPGELRAAAYNGLARLKRWGTDDWRNRIEDDDDALRASAITNLGHDDNAHDAAGILADALRQDSNPHVRRMAAIGLARLRNPAYAEHLANALTDPNPAVRRYAVEGLANLQAEEYVPNILMAMQSNVAAQHLNRALMMISDQDFGFDPNGSLPERQQAIERAFVWYSSRQR
ncbi:MAG: hypothetical protein EA401_01780, partial [Planctomycetota bacterium]